VIQRDCPLRRKASGCGDEAGPNMAVMYGGYYDESMDDVSFAVAGYIAPYDTWIHLDWAWRDLLKAWKIKYFKASECENGLGEFAQYRDNPADVKSRLKTHEWERLQEAKNQFIDAIVKHSDFIQGAGAATILKDFNRIISEEPEARRLFREHPYYVCFQGALAASTKKMYEENSRRATEGKLYIKPIFDSHKDFSDIARIAYERFREINTRAATILLPIGYEDDIDTPALQAADMLAYEMRKYMTKVVQNPERPIRKQLERLTPTVERVFKLDYNTLKVILVNQRPRKAEC
jgi:hypothetical protein